MFIPMDIPGKYFPLVLYAFFCLFSGLILSYFLSIVIGYCYACGYIDSLKIPQSFLMQSESNGMLSSLSRRIGWVPIGSALGHQAWTATAPGQGSQNNAQTNISAAAPGGAARVFGFGNSSNTDPEAGNSARHEREPLLEQVI